MNTEKPLEQIAHAEQHSRCHAQTGGSIKQAGGIIFTDENGNIVTDDDEKEEEYMTEDEPIPVANNDNEENVNVSREETAIKGAPQAITGVNNKKMQMNQMTQGMSGGMRQFHKQWKYSRTKYRSGRKYI